MAWTVSHTVSVWGNKSVDIVKVVADAATQTVSTRLSAIDGFAIGPISMASGAPLISPSSGDLICSGFASGDECYITVYGR